MRINAKSILFQIGLGALAVFSACGQKNGQNNIRYLFFWKLLLKEG